MNSSSSILSLGVPTRQNMLKEVEMKMVKTFYIIELNKNSMEANQ